MQTNQREDLEESFYGGEIPGMDSGIELGVDNGFQLFFCFL